LLEIIVNVTTKYLVRKWISMRILKIENLAFSRMSEVIINNDMKNPIEELAGKLAFPETLWGIYKEL